MTGLPEKFELTRGQVLAIGQLCKAMKMLPKPLMEVLGLLVQVPDVGQLEAGCSLQLTGACIQGAFAVSQLEDIEVWAGLLEQAN